MKYTIERLGGDPITFEQFCEKHGLSVTVHERNKHSGLPRFFASDGRVEVLGDHVLIGCFGDGGTPEAAIEDYAQHLSGHRIVVGAYSTNRREIQCPNEWEPR